MPQDWQLTLLIVRYCSGGKYGSFRGFFSECLRHLGNMSELFQSSRMTGQANNSSDRRLCSGVFKVPVEKGNAMSSQQGSAPRGVKHNSRIRQTASSCGADAQASRVVKNFDAEIRGLETEKRIMFAVQANVKYEAWGW